MFTIINTPLVPLRAEAGERSEMVSQLLFGEQIEILQRSEKWLLVKNCADGYTGWIAESAINTRFFSKNATDTTLFKAARAPLLTCFKTSGMEKITLPGGSMLPPVADERFELAGEMYQIDRQETAHTPNDERQQAVELARQYLHAPYLWGGKTVLGMDCSGLVQVVFAMLGKQLPRDASQQVEMGKVVDFLSEAQPADLAFFENAAGHISHVGILLNARQIIHASGWVKIETIDSQGIISSKNGEYTHKLRVIKRMM